MNASSPHIKQTTCKHDGYLSSSHSRKKAELRCTKCGKVWRTRG